MVSPKSQEIIDRIVGERIATLAEFIRSGTEPHATLAAEQLALIGSKAAADMLAKLSIELENEELAYMAMVSPFRDDYREMLKQYIPQESMAEIEAELWGIDVPLVSIQPLLQSIVEALEVDFKQRLAKERTAIYVDAD